MGYHRTYEVHNYTNTCSLDLILSEKRYNIQPPPKKTAFATLRRLTGNSKINYWI